MVDMWIRVEDGLPEVFRNERGELLPFLVGATGFLFPFEAFYDGKVWTSEIGEPNVTHWMPLFSLPMEKKPIKERRDKMDFYGISKTRLRELAQADKEGRCMVLPCKVGDTIYYISPEIYQAKIEEHIVIGYLITKDVYKIISFNPKGKIIYFRFEFIGKTVFLTREEAEAALRGE